jgi:small subunit ribosomal protein S20
MPNTSSAKKALRGSKKKQTFNNSKKYKIKQSLKELRKVLANKPSSYKTTLSKVFSSLDKAVKTNLIPKGRADRKKSRLSSMVEKALGNKAISNKDKKTLKLSTPKVTKSAEKKVTKVVKKTTTKTPAKKLAPKKTTAKTPAKKSVKK